MRDALSILDQAIAHGAGSVEAAAVQQMLGLADRARIVDLFESVMKGDTAAALAELQAQHETGADPIVVLTDLADFTHYVTRLKVAPEAAGRAAVSETERVRGTVFAAELSLAVLSRAWQMLVKGIEEASEAPRPLIAADMVLVRLCHAAELPTPDDALRMLRENGGSGASARAAPARQASVRGASVARGGEAPPIQGTRRHRFRSRGARRPVRKQRRGSRRSPNPAASTARRLSCAASTMSSPMRDACATGCWSLRWSGMSGPCGSSRAASRSR